MFIVECGGMLARAGEYDDKHTRIRSIVISRAKKSPVIVIPLSLVALHLFIFMQTFCTEYNN